MVPLANTRLHVAVSIFPLQGMLGQRAHCSWFPGHRRVLLPASSLTLWLWYLGNYHPAPPPPGPITAVSQEERPCGCSGPTDIPIPSPWMDRATGFSGFLRLEQHRPCRQHNIAILGCALPWSGQCKARGGQVPFAAQSGMPKGHVPVSVGNVRAGDFLMVLRSIAGLWGQALGFFNTGAAVLTLFFIIMNLNPPGFLPELIREEELWIICNI